MKDAVENHKTRKELEESIKKLQKQHLWFLYDMKRKVHLKHKDERAVLCSNLEKMRREFEPAHNKREQTKKDVQNLKKLIQDKTEEAKKTLSRDDHLRIRYEQLEESLQEALGRYAEKKAAEEQRQRELQDFSRQLDMFLGQLCNLPELDTEQVEKKLEELSQKISKASQKQVELRTSQEEALTTRRSIERKIAACEQELNSIQDVSKQRLELLRRRNLDAYNALKWLEVNKDKFSAPVYAPICTQINIKHSGYAKYVENRISENDLMAFVCESKDDMNLFKELMDKQGIRVNIVDSGASSMNQCHSKIPIHHLRKFGFETYMLDCIDAPPAILAFLCRQYQIADVPIAQRGILEDLPVELKTFYIGDERISHSQSRYDGCWSTTISQIREARLLHITLDTQRIQYLVKSIADCRHQIAKIEAELEKIKDEDSSLGKQVDDWRSDKRILTSRLGERKVLEKKIEVKRGQIERWKEKEINLQEEEGIMKVQQQGVVKNMIRVCIECGMAAKESVELFQKHQRLVGQAKTEYAALQTIENQIMSSEQEIATFEENLKKSTDEFIAYKKEAQGALQKLLRALGVSNYQQIKSEIREEFQHSNLQETERLLTEKEAHRDCLTTASASELQDYHKREVEIRQLRRQLDEAQMLVENHQEELETSRNIWLPRITELTENLSTIFSRFMARLGCAGEVILDKAEDVDDFSKYGIVIKVRFRDNDRLRELTAHHQSGGERAVSTALYLLALQSLTTVPFRCVDEINQGMDPINERQMLNMLMETVAAEGSSQYFFVSPKLIPDMECNDYVDMMVVNNSPSMLPHRKITLKRILRKKYELNKRAAKR
ncbi:hypothetical protein OTU49_007795 [Cherax quadricarinatus]|uniref:Structural maintenance of chromosomes protein 5 n=1 Tax=Cherax quadricarinatus TaxID=27406 RepID=A0AAW0WTH0_CHEQU